jgi:predicted RNA-binding Zn-ribbon protein involved in translation (DUF1610 family)
VKDFTEQIIHFGCRACDRELRTSPETAGGLVCPDCGQPARLHVTATVRSGRKVDLCAVCGHGDFYVQKDFNRTLGISIVVVGVSISLVFFARNQPFAAMLALFGTAMVDLAIYFLVGEVTVCYACHALYRGFGPNPDHATFDLELLERYGGRPPRK